MIWFHCALFLSYYTRLFHRNWTRLGLQIYPIIYQWELNQRYETQLSSSVINRSKFACECATKPKSSIWGKINATPLELACILAFEKRWSTIRFPLLSTGSEETLWSVAWNHSWKLVRRETRQFWSLEPRGGLLLVDSSGQNCAVCAFGQIIEKDSAKIHLTLVQIVEVIVWFRLWMADQ